MTCLVLPSGLRAPVSASATISSSASRLATVWLVSVISRSPPRLARARSPRVRSTSKETGRPRPPRRLGLLHPAFFLVEFQRARMDRRRQALAHHVLRIEMREGRVQLLELVEVLERRLDE